MASDTAGVKAAIEGALAAAWDEDATPIAWEHMRGFTPPDEGAWLQVTILWGDGFELAMEPSRTNQVVGVLVGNVFTPPRIGTGLAHRLADQFRDVFNRKTIGGVRFDPASGPKPGPDSEWIQRTVEVPFTVIETA